MSSVSDLGEFALIERLIARLPSGEGVLVGPGDDAAVLASPDGPMLAAADLLVEGTHFDLAFSRPVDVGYKAMAVNVSDIAAMGGVARYALVSVGVAGDRDAREVESVYEGLAQAAGEFGLIIVGGDTVGAVPMIVSVAIIGEVGPHGVVRRSGAQPGDALCVTGALGAAAAGLTLFRTRSDKSRALLEQFPNLAIAHRRGRARVAEGVSAAASGARAMIDISDGLLADVEHICAASHVRVRIDGRALPVAPGVAETEALLGRAGDVSLFAARGGDDYELAIAIPPERVEELARAIAPTPLTRVGTFEAGEGIEVDGLDESDLIARGWDHFRR